MPKATPINFGPPGVRVIHHGQLLQIAALFGGDADWQRSLPSIRRSDIRSCSGLGTRVLMTQDGVEVWPEGSTHQSGVTERCDPGGWWALWALGSGAASGAPTRLR